MGGHRKRKLRKAMRGSLEVIGALALQTLADYLRGVVARKSKRHEGSTSSAG